MSDQRPSPCIGGGFRAVFVTPTTQWILNLRTGEAHVVHAPNCIQLGHEVKQDKLITVASPRKYKFGSAGPEVESQPHEDDSPAYKLFNNVMMLRPDGSFFFFDLKEKTSASPSNNFGLRTCTCKGIQQEEVEFVVYVFARPPHEDPSTRFFRLADWQAAMGLSRTDVVDARWVNRNWESWQTAFCKLVGCALSSWPAFRSRKSQKALNEKNPEQHAVPIAGVNCMESWAMSAVPLTWLFVRLWKTCKADSPQQTYDEKVAIKKTFTNFLRQCLPEEGVIPLSDDHSDDATFLTSPGFRTSPQCTEAYLQLRQDKIISLDSLQDSRSFNWLQKALKRPDFKLDVPICIFKVAVVIVK